MAYPENRDRFELYPPIVAPSLELDVEYEVRTKWMEYLNFDVENVEIYTRWATDTAKDNLKDKNIDWTK